MISFPSGGGGGDGGQAKIFSVQNCTFLELAHSMKTELCHGLHVDSRQHSRDIRSQ
jgi:hypothetical protein